MALDFFAGCVGGCAGILVGHPFDTVKVRIQTQDFRNPQYRGAIHCFTKTLKKESIGGLYKGMSSPMAGVAVVNAIVFGVYGNFQRNLPNPDALSTHFLAGAAAGFVQSFVCSPMELVKTRLQLQQNASPSAGGYSGPINCIIQVARTDGIRGIFRGLGTTICREIPGFGTYFLSYELMTRTSQENGEHAVPISTLHMLLAGGLSGTLSWVMTYPIDVVKSRLQADGIGGKYKYSGFMDCLKKSVQTEGYGVLSRGLTSTILRAFPTNAATFTVVTWVIRWANANNVNETGYIIANVVDDEVLDINTKFDEDFSGKVFGFKANRVIDENTLNWRKMLMHNFIASNVFNNTHMVYTANNLCNSSETDCSNTSLTEKVKKEIHIQLEEDQICSLEKAGSILLDIRSEDSLENFSEKNSSLVEKEPNNYEHKNDYYNSSVR